MKYNRGNLLVAVSFPRMHARDGVAMLGELLCYSSGMHALWKGCHGGGGVGVGLELGVHPVHWGGSVPPLSVMSCQCPG